MKRITVSSESGVSLRALRYGVLVVGSTSVGNPCLVARIGYTGLRRWIPCLLDDQGDCWVDELIIVCTMGLRGFQNG